VLKEEFIKRSIILFGDKFKYDLLPEEFKAHDKIKLICKIHGEIEVKVYIHLDNHDCKQCALEKWPNERIQKKANLFFKKAKKIYGDK
jgi:hypothetical protein